MTLVEWLGQVRELEVGSSRWDHRRSRRRGRMKAGVPKEIKSDEWLRQRSGQVVFTPCGTLGARPEPINVPIGAT
jgi:hypothetical protein